MPTVSLDDILIKSLTSRDLHKVRDLHVRLCIMMYNFLIWSRHVLIRQLVEIVASRIPSSLFPSAAVNTHPGMFCRLR